ncbi:hypothetical protein BG000_006746 [Podila horticola]|nr:hypothetical protein BG000_006746 [Podila horticola]
MPSSTADKRSSRSPDPLDARSIINSTSRRQASRSPIRQQRHISRSPSGSRSLRGRSPRSRSPGRRRTSPSRSRSRSKSPVFTNRDRDRSQSPIFTRNINSNKNNNNNNNRSRSRSASPDLSKGLQSASAAARRGRSRSHSRSRSPGRPLTPRASVRSPSQDRNREDRGRPGSPRRNDSRERGNRDSKGNRSWSPRGRDARSGSRRDSRSRSPERRDSNNNTDRFDPRRRQRAWGSRSRSRSPPRRASPPNRGRGDRDSSPTGDRRGYGRRQSPSYDHYQPPRRDEDRGRDEGRRFGGRDEVRGYGGRDGQFRGGRGDHYSRDGDDRGGYRGGRDDRDNEEPRRDDQPYRGGRRAQGQMPEFSDSRREQRMAIKFSIWAPSPTEEELRNRSPSPDREVKKKPASKSKSKKNDSDSDSDSDDSRSDRKRRHKSSKRRKENKSSRHKSRKSSGRSSKRRRYDASEDEIEDDKRSSRRDKRRSRSESRSVSPSHRSPRTERDTDDKKNALASAHVSREEPEMEFPDDMWVEKKVEMPDDDMEVGPVPIHLGDNKMNERSYGGALLAGEGSAMAAYVQDGKRIPRRGEIGLESDEIENYEHAGFVMSGSRHQRMNAVRVRKENQVISAEEKRAIMIFNQEEKIKKDNKIINEMREMVASKMRSTGHSI